MLLSEIPQVLLAEPIVLGDGRQLARIDLRAERWRVQDDDEKTEKAKNELQVTLSLPTFYGLIPVGHARQWLTYDGNDKTLLTITFAQPSGEINLDDMKIEGSWWDYVRGIDMDNNVVKNPLPQFDDAASEPSVAAI